MTPATVHIIPGKKQTSYTSMFPSRRYWYRHDKVEVNGTLLDGFIQTKCRNYGKRIGTRVETITCYGDACVMGQSVDWLIRMNADKGIR